MKSKYFSTCSKCEQKINKGDEIVKSPKSGKWVHEVCPVNNKSDAPNPFRPSKSKLDGINVPLAVENSAEHIDEKSFSVQWTPSKYQVNFFEWLVNGAGNAVMEAVAGSGKTTTLVRSLQYLPLVVAKNKGLLENNIPFDQFENQLERMAQEGTTVAGLMSSMHVAFLAFNKHIAKELQNKLAGMDINYVHVSTIHSLGYSICRKLEDCREVDADKLSSIMDEWYPSGRDVKDNKARKENREKRMSLRKIVALAKATLVDADDASAVNAMLERFGFEDANGYTDELISMLPKVLNACIENTKSIDYDDMIWLPLVHPRLKNHFEKFDTLFVDEAQDLNNAQTQFIMNSVRPESRIIVVGDRYQSLYGFRGADTDAIPNLIRNLNATVLPLSISYRCPKSHVMEAKNIVPHIEFSETAIEGEILHIDYKQFMTTVKEGDMVVCRTNAPLVKPAYTLIKAGIKAIIRGKDIGRQLINYIERFEATTLGELEVSMSEYHNREVQRFLDKGKEMLAIQAQDKYETILSVSRECKTVEELLTKLEILFSDTSTGVIFSSVHRAKGLEATNIFIIREDLMPHPKAKQDWEVVQEWNVKYVALTRSKKSLIYVEQEVII